MIKYYNIENTEIGLGFITHRDQEILNLSFEIRDVILKVTGEESSILEWETNKNLGNYLDQLSLENYFNFIAAE